MKYCEFEEIKTKHLLLRKLRMADAECYYAHIGSSEEVTRYMLWNPHESLQESHDSIVRILTKYESGRCYTWAITRIEDDELIGRIDLLRFDERDNSCSFAYMLGKKFWGKGYGTEALKAVFSFAFKNLEVESIVADHMSENIASGRVMQKAGMAYMGRYVAKYEKNGSMYDADAYQITFDDWKKQTE